MEVVAHMLNINFGHNQKLMKKCRKLKEYAQFVLKVRECMKLTKEQENSTQELLTKEEAVEWAVEECIKEGILVDVLTNERARIVQAVLGEYDEEEYEKMIRGESYQDGVEEGMVIGEQRFLKLSQILLSENRMEDFQKSLSDAAFREKLYQEIEQ